MNLIKILIPLVSLNLFLYAEQVKVTEVTEITKPYTTKVKVGEDCFEDTVEVYVRCPQTDTNSIGIDTLIGTAIGVAIGNQIGKGSGKDTAKVVGGLLGASTANSNRNRSCKSYETITKCVPRYNYKTEYKTIGYNNCAVIDGVRYCKQTKEPVTHLRIKKTVTVY
ncbi:MAG: glycine zipper 2TM domain-containing protein [Campylobacterota bacterium]|nr:glycine zipper 2TM domain-containing protein [Campylobacterota bacterium]